MKISWPAGFLSLGWSVVRNRISFSFFAVFVIFIFDTLVSNLLIRASPTNSLDFPRTASDRNHNSPSTKAPEDVVMHLSAKILQLLARVLGTGEIHGADHRTVSPTDRRRSKV